MGCQYHLGIIGKWCHHIMTFRLPVTFEMMQETRSFWPNWWHVKNVTPSRNDVSWIFASANEAQLLWHRRTSDPWHSINHKHSESLFWSFRRYAKTIWLSIQKVVGKNCISRQDLINSSNCTAVTATVSSIRGIVTARIGAKRPLLATSATWIWPSGLTTRRLQHAP